MQIGLMGSFASWAALLIGSSQRILLVVENASCAQEAHIRLVRVGLENVVGYTVANKQEWQQHGLEPISMPIHRCEDIRHALLANPSPQLIDVRSWAEWLQGHLPDAICMPLLELSAHTASIDRFKPILVYCQEGYRATIAASMLLRDHVGGIGILTGSVQKWQACRMPLEMSRNENIGSSPFRTRRTPL
jgi:rhodanese-related sulfurtransferase